MKSYIQGLITGGVFVFAFIILSGSQNQESDKGIGRFQLVNFGGDGINKKTYMKLLDTETGDLYIQGNNSDNKNNWVINRSIRF